MNRWTNPPPYVITCPHLSAIDVLDGLTSPCAEKVCEGREPLPGLLIVAAAVVSLMVLLASVWPL